MTKEQKNQLITLGNVVILSVIAVFILIQITKSSTKSREAGDVAIKNMIHSLLQSLRERTDVVEEEIKLIKKEKEQYKKAGEYTSERKENLLKRSIAVDTKVEAIGQDYKIIRDFLSSRT